MSEEDATNHPRQEDRYELCLYITGASPNSARAIEHISAICEQYLEGRYTLSIIDVHQEPEAAAREQIIALPLLIKRAPLPERRLIGDMSDTQKVLRVLGLPYSTK